jgi:arsenate reductase
MASNFQGKRWVLFVCVHNAGRSQMAAALFNRMASDRNLDVRAGSAGTVAGSKVNLTAVEAMAEIGIDMSAAQPKQLSQEMVDEAARIITMGCGVDAEACPARFLVTEDWGLDDPAGQPIEVVRRVRDEIARRVAALLDEIGE